MTNTEFNRMSGIVPAETGLSKGLLMSTAFTPAARAGGTTPPPADDTSFDRMMGGGAEEQSNTAAALLAREKKKKKSAAFVLLRDMINEEHKIYESDVYPWSSRVRRMRRMRRVRGDLDGRRANTGDADARKQVAVDEDGKRVVMDADGRVATDADGKRITIEEDGHRIADAGDGRRVLVDPEGRVLNDADGRVIVVDDSSTHRITVDEDGTRVAVSESGSERIVMRDADAPALTPDSAARRAEILETDPRTRAASDAIETLDRKTGMFGRTVQSSGEIERATREIDGLTAMRNNAERIAKRPADILLGKIAAENPDVATRINQAVSEGRYRQAARIAEKAQIGEWAFWSSRRRQYTSGEVKNWNARLREVSNFARNRGEIGYKQANRDLRQTQRTLDKASMREAKTTAARIQDMVRDGRHVAILDGVDNAASDPYTRLLRDYAEAGGEVPSRGQIMKDLEARGLSQSQISRQGLAAALTENRERIATAALAAEAETARTAAADADVDNSRLTTTPGDDLETVRTQGADAEAGRAAPIADTFNTAEGSSTRRFETFLAQNGESLQDFQARATAAIDGGAAAGGTRGVRGVDADIPTSRLNVGHVRTGRFIRMLTPNGLDIAVTGTVAGGVGLYSGVANASPTIDEDGIGIDFNEGAALKGAGETLPVVGTSIAYSEGRTAEGTVRAIEDVVEFGSPFVFAAIGAGGGAVAGGGVFSIPGAIIGGIGGLAVGIVVSLTASEVTRGIARGIGFDDVDRGMIGSWFAPEYAEEMEGWIRSVTADGEGFREGESLSDVMERINENAETSHERTENFRQLLDRINVGIVENQEAQIGRLAERMSRDTGIAQEDLMATLRLPEARARITAFYQNEAAQNPNDPAVAEILGTLAEFEATEAERIKVVAARIGADTMDAREMNEVLEDNVKGTFREYTQRDARRSRPDGFRAVQRDLDSIDFADRMADIRARIGASDDVAVGDVIQASFANGTTAYEEMGTVSVLADSYTLMLDAEEALMASQQQMVEQNWEQIQQYMRADAHIEGGMMGLGRDRTMLEKLQEDLEDADYGDPTARDLRELLRETNNLENITQEQAGRLLSNAMFAEAFGRAIEDDRDLRNTLRDAGYDRRAEAIEDARASVRRLEESAREYGFQIGPDNEVGADAEPSFWNRLVSGDLAMMETIDDGQQCRVVPR